MHGMSAVCIGISLFVQGNMLDVRLWLMNLTESDTSVHSTRTAVLFKLFAVNMSVITGCMKLQRLLIADQQQVRAVPVQSLSSKPQGCTFQIC
jgi:hypothetical protein